MIWVLKIVQCVDIEQNNDLENKKDEKITVAEKDKWMINHKDVDMRNIEDVDK